jgi:hypothetical protein
VLSPISLRSVCRTSLGINAKASSGEPTRKETVPNRIVCCGLMMIKVPCVFVQ